jgi:hypothetical protein
MTSGEDTNRDLSRFDIAPPLHKSLQPLPLLNLVNSHLPKESTGTGQPTAVTSLKKKKKKKKKNK